MKRIVLLRHGESTWNKDNRFTGWTDVDLTEKGIADANQAGILLKEKGFHFDKAYTSFLKRAVKTLNCVLDKMDQDWIPVEKSWRLNEKHYGALQGLNKSETASKYGEEQVLIWRRSFNVAPKALSEGQRSSTYRISERNSRTYITLLEMHHLPQSSYSKRTAGSSSRKQPQRNY